jgi:hypothetical protein
MARKPTPKGKGRARDDYDHKIPAQSEGDPHATYDKQMSKEMVDAIVNWGHDMDRWGQTVRDDIVRLEAALGLPPGDPGDPPPPPWE